MSRGISREMKSAINRRATKLALAAAMLYAARMKALAKSGGLPLDEVDQWWPVDLDPVLDPATGAAIDVDPLDPVRHRDQARGAGPEAAP